MQLSSTTLSHNLEENITNVHFFYILPLTTLDHIQLLSRVFFFFLQSHSKNNNIFPGTQNYSNERTLRNERTLMIKVFFAMCVFHMKGDSLPYRCVRHSGSGCSQGNISLDPRCLITHTKNINQPFFPTKESIGVAPHGLTKFNLSFYDRRSERCH